ncbi:penicillin-binding protein 1A [Alphaproteobacteria bacterium]|nr:penicillin-binding protein 1A [Alphaproteobacteria bacterium]
MARFFKTIISGLLLITVCSALFLVAIFYFFGAGLTDYKQLQNYNPPVITRLYTSNGRPFAEYATEKRLFVPIENIPPIVRNAFMAAEDKNFYHHFGIDLVGILRASLRNIALIASGRRPHGASTITQQVARHFLLTETSSHVSLTRKIKEAILALRMEAAYTKDHILELYLNDIFLGSRSYGVAAAALNYFNKSLDELTAEEAALLAALPKAPSHYAPRKNPVKAKQRRNWVLERMAEEEFITPQQAKEAQEKEISLRKRVTKSVKSDYFAEEVRRFLINEFGEKALYEDGLVVRTTMNPDLQALAHKTLREGLVAYDRRHGWRGPVALLPLFETELQSDGWVNRLNNIDDPAGAGEWALALVLDVDEKAVKIGFKDGTTGTIPLKELTWARQYFSPSQMGPAITHPQEVCTVGDVLLTTPIDGNKETYKLCQTPLVSGGLMAINPHTGSVLAMSGGFSFEISQFNRATQAMRQPGSAFKPFVFLSALEHGLTPSTSILDAPLAINLGTNLGTYRPKNYSKLFYGPTTLRVSLEKSRNVPTVRIIHEVVGIDKVAEVSQRMGIYDNMPPLLSMALGAGESTLQRMVGAFCSFVNGGRQVIPSFVERIQDRYGKAIHVSQLMSCDTADSPQTWHGQPPPTLKDERTFVVDPAHAYQMTSILEGAVQRGTAVSAKVLNRPIAEKTGSSNDFFDAWAIGYTPDLVVGIYIGYDAPMTLGDKEQAARVAAPIFVNFMREALKDVPATPFRVPPGIVHVNVNHDTGHRASPNQSGTILEAFKAGTEASLFKDSPAQRAKKTAGQIKGLGGVY